MSSQAVHANFAVNSAGRDLTKRQSSRLSAVAIGMPVRNGELYIADAIESLLNQDFEDFQLTISDNASEDATPDICRAFAASDPRVSYSRLAQDFGPAQNFNHVLSLAQARYFMWAAHDDLWEPTYISSCFHCLERQPNAISCFTGVELIDEFGKHFGLVLDDGGLTSLDWADRAAAIVARRDGYLGFGFYGLHRKQILDRVVPLGDQFGADVLLTLRLAKLGPWCWVSNPLFRYRVRTEPVSVSPIWTATDAEARPVSRLRKEVLRELNEDCPGLREKLLIRRRLCRSSFLGGSWNKFLVGENSALIRSSIARRDLMGVARHSSRHMVLDPISLLKPANWARAARVGKSLWQTRQNRLQGR